MPKVGVYILGFSDFVWVGVDLLQELKHVGRIKERVVRVGSPSGMEVISGFSFCPSKYVEHVVTFSFLLVIVPIYLSIYKVLLLLVGRVYTIIKLVRVINLIRTT